MDDKCCTQNDIDDEIVLAVKTRESEWHNYELNRQSHIAVLDSAELRELPEQWPTEIAKWRGTHGEALAAALDGDEYLLAVKLQFRDRVRLLLKTTIAEQTKCRLCCEAAKSQLPPQERIDASLSRIAARMNRA